VDIHRVFHNVVTEVISFTIGDTTFDASTGHPQGKASRMMIAAVVVFSQRALRTIRPNSPPQTQEYHPAGLVVLSPG
jgi:hypothetical protein